MTDQAFCPGAFRLYERVVPRGAVLCPECDQLVELTFNPATNDAFFAGHVPNEPPFWRSQRESKGVGREQQWRGLVKEGRKIVWRGEWTRHEPEAYEAARDVAVAHNLGKS